MNNLQDFIVDSYNNGCTNFKMNTHITPDGTIKVRLESVGRYHAETDGIIKNDQVTLFENVC